VFILTLQDGLLKFAWAAPLPNHEENTIAKFFVIQIVCLHGRPQSLETDCGTEFLRKVFKEVCQFKQNYKKLNKYLPVHILHKVMSLWTEVTGH